MNKKVLGEISVEANENDKIDKNDIKRIRSGNTAVINEIIERYKAFVYAKAKPFFIVGAEKEDIVQEGMIGLFKAIQNYDETKDVSFKAFADLCVRRQIMTAIKAATRQKHIPLNSYLSLSKNAFDDESDKTVMEVLDVETAPDPLDTITMQETYEKIETRMNEVLSDFEQRVLNEYLKGCSYAEIANSLGSHVKAVDNAVQRIKKKVDKYIVEDKM